MGARRCFKSSLRKLALEAKLAIAKRSDDVGAAQRRIWKLSQVMHKSLVLSSRFNDLGGAVVFPITFDYS